VGEAGRVEAGLHGGAAAGGAVEVDEVGGEEEAGAREPLHQGVRSHSAP
jgi:hypothetical protein